MNDQETTTTKRPPKEPNSEKTRLIVLYKFFYENTDEDHQVTYDDIFRYLKENDVLANHMTVRDDIRLLIELGYDIVRVPSRPVKYFMGEREMEAAEVKLLIDAVSSSRFITAKKSRELAKKLGNLTSQYQRKDLKRNIHATHRAKTDNEEIYYTVDVVNSAINSRKKISFQYTEYTPKEGKVLRNDGEVYELSPYALFWNEDYYYVVGWSDKHQNVSVFRTDRLYKPQVLREKAVKRPDDFSLEAYSKRIFEMYDGDPVEVRLKCKNDLMKYIVDRFGPDFEMSRAGKDTFIATVEVSLSPTFYAWVFTFGGGIRIMTPKKAVTEFRDMAKAVLE